MKVFPWLVTVATLSSPVHAEEEGEGGTSTAPRPDEHAQAWFEQGQAAYANGEFAIAANLFRAVYESTHAPAVLYDVAQAERLAKQCDQALADYQEYVRVASRDAPNDVAEKIAEMRQCAARESKPPPAAPAPRGGTGTPAPRFKDPGAEERAALRATAYGSIVGSILCAGFGTIYLVQANSANAHLDELNNPGAKWGERYASYESSANRSSQAALGFFIASGVLAAAATTILVFRWPRDIGAPRASVSVLMHAGGTGLSYRLRF